MSAAALGCLKKALARTFKTKRIADPTVAACDQGRQDFALLRVNLGMRAIQSITVFAAEFPNIHARLYVPFNREGRRSMKMRRRPDSKTRHDPALKRGSRRLHASSQITYRQFIDILLNPTVHGWHYPVLFYY